MFAVASWSRDVLFLAFSEEKKKSCLASLKVDFFFFFSSCRKKTSTGSLESGTYYRVKISGRPVVRWKGELLLP